MNTQAKPHLVLVTVTVVAVVLFGVVGLTPVPVSADKQYDVNFSGPTTGRVGEKLTYNVDLSVCTGIDRRTTAPDRCVKASNVPLGISIYNYEPGYPTVGFIEVTTDANGQASFAFKFPSVGHYGLRLWGGSLGINAVIQDVTITTPVIPVGAITAPKAATPSPTEAPAATSTTPIDNGEQSNGGVSAQTSTAGDARHAETASESVVGDEGATTQGMPGPGIAVVLLTIVALALLMRRGREEENDYEEERPYERERRYRRQEA